MTALPATAATTATVDHRYCWSMFAHSIGNAQLLTELTLNEFHCWQPPFTTDLAGRNNVAVSFVVAGCRCWRCCIGHS